MTPEEAAKKYSWIRIAEDGVPEFYLDHSMLSAFRNCQSYFELTYLRSLSTRERNWNFDFGSWVHSSMEKFYLHEQNKLKTILEPNFVIPEGEASLYEYITKGEFLAHGLMLWDKYEMDYFDGKHKNYKVLKGALGAAKLLSDYYEVYGNGNERLRVVGIELPFGLKKEAPIIDWKTREAGHGKPEEDDMVYDYNNLYYPKWVGNWMSDWKPFRGYLTGRIDLLVDDLVSIAVFDHKSTAFFNGSESTKFTPQDGMRGYVYAADRMLRKINPDKRCTKMIINHICLGEGTSKEVNPKGDNHKEITVMDAKKRFTRTSISYSPESLQEYVRLQQPTFADIYSLIIDERPAQWNTNVCGNMFHRDCPFKNIHSLTPSIREDVMKQQLKVIEAWTPFYDEKVITDNERRNNGGVGDISAGS